MSFPRYLMPSFVFVDVISLRILIGGTWISHPVLSLRQPNPPEAHLLSSVMQCKQYKYNLFRYQFLIDIRINSPGVSLEFYGSWVEVYGSFDLSGGSVVVEVDNVVTTVSTPNVGDGQLRGLLFRAELKAAGEHTVVLSWNGGRAVTFEKFVVGPV